MGAIEPALSAEVESRLASLSDGSQPQKTENRQTLTIMIASATQCRCPQGSEFTITASMRGMIELIVQRVVDATNLAVLQFLWNPPIATQSGQDSEQGGLMPVQFIAQSD